MKRRVKISKHILSILICFAMMFSIMPMAAFAAAAKSASEEPAEHTHPLDGGENMVWTGITSIGTQLSSGNYCLQGDVQCSNISVNGTVNLCLNGKSLTSKDDKPKKITINQGARLNLWDCKGNGSSSLVIENKGTLHIYGGTYGGKYIVNGRTNYTRLINNAGTLHIHDATINADIEMIDNTGTLTIDDGTFSVASVWTNVWCIDNAGGIAVINGGSFTSSSSHTIYSNGGSSASLTIDGGTFSNTSTEAFVLYVTHGTCTINDGTFNACSKATIKASAPSTCKIVITGGDFTSSEGNNIISYSSSKKDTVEISGGTFTTENGIAKVMASDGSVSGGTFVRGISMSNLADKLTDGYAYYQKGEKVELSSSTGRPAQRDITGGDVTVEKAPEIYTVSASVSSENTGTVTGGGAYEEGDIARLTATAKEGYTFVNWTENGTVVSTSTEYTFTVTRNHTLVAMFGLSHVCADHLTEKEAKDATCIKAGNTKYYSCTCGKYYQDAEAQTEIAKDSWVITDADAHEWNEPTYTQQDGKHVAHYVCELNGTHTKQDDPADHVYSVLDYTCVCKKVQQFTIAFYIDGKEHKVLTQDYGTAVTAPENPTKDGYIFAGWADEAGNIVSFPLNMPLGGMKLTAVWEKMPDLPKTGDNAYLSRWLVFMTMSGAALLLLRRRARN